MENLEPIKPSQLKEVLKLAYARSRPVMTWGAPGLGKTEIHEQVAAELGIGYFYMPAPLYTPIDVRGLLYFDTKKGEARWHVPNTLPTKGKGILFIDEIVQAVGAVQAQLSQLLVPPFRCGEYELPKGWVPMAAGNRQSDRAAANAMPRHIVRRLQHFEIMADVDDWVEHAVKIGVRPEIIGFVKAKPDVLHKFDPKINQPFPCPATWVALSEAMDQGQPKSLELQTYTANIGRGAATEFIGFLEVFNQIPIIKEVLKDPDNAPLPPRDKPSIAYTVCIGLAYKAAKDTFAAIVRYGERLGPEYMALLMQSIQQRYPEATERQEFRDWALKHHELISV